MVYISFGTSFPPVSVKKHSLGPKLEIFFAYKICVHTCKSPSALPPKYFSATFIISLSPLPFHEFRFISQGFLTCPCLCCIFSDKGNYFLSCISFYLADII